MLKFYYYYNDDDMTYMIYKGIWDECIMSHKRVPEDSCLIVTCESRVEQA